MKHDYYSCDIDKVRIEGKKVDWATYPYGHDIVVKDRLPGDSGGEVYVDVRLLITDYDKRELDLCGECKAAINEAVGRVIRERWTEK